MKSNIELINNLIPLASHYATVRCKQVGARIVEKPGVDGKPYNYDYWSEYFHKEMNRLAIEKGLRYETPGIKHT